MKKYAYLILVLSFLLTGCANLSHRLTLPGGPLLPRDQLVYVEQDIEDGAREYHIADELVVSLSGDANCVRIAEKLFSDLGFLVAGQGYNGPIDFAFLVRRENLAQGGSYGYGLGYFGNQKSVVRA